MRAIFPMRGTFSTRAALSMLIAMAVHLAAFSQSAEERATLLKQEGVLSVEGASRMDERARRASAAGEDNDDPAQTRGNLGLSVGTSYSYSSGFGSGMLFYAAPTYTLPLTDRLAFHGGFIATHYQGFTAPVYGEFYSPLQFSSLAVFAAASYRMNDRLVLHGTGVKQLISAPSTPFTPYPMDHFSVGATYRLGNNISVGATIHINNGGPYPGTPFNSYGAVPPYFW